MNGTEEEHRRKIIIEGGVPGDPLSGDLCTDPPTAGQAVLCIAYFAEPDDQDRQKLTDEALKAGAEVWLRG